MSCCHLPHEVEVSLTLEGGTTLVPYSCLGQLSAKVDIFVKLGCPCKVYPGRVNILECSFDVLLHSKMQMKGFTLVISYYTGQWK